MNDLTQERIWVKMFLCPQKRASSESQNVRTTQKDFCWNEFNIKVILTTLPPTLDIWLHWYTAWKNKQRVFQNPNVLSFQYEKGKPNISTKYINYDKFNFRSKVCMNHRLLLHIQYRLAQCICSFCILWYFLWYGIKII